MSNSTDKSTVYNKNKISLYIRKGIEEETRKWILEQDPSILVDILSKYHTGELITKEQAELQAYKMAIQIITQSNISISQSANANLANNVNLAKIENVISKDNDIENIAPRRIDEHKNSLDKASEEVQLEQHKGIETNTNKNEEISKSIENKKIEKKEEVSAAKDIIEVPKTKKQSRLDAIRENMAKDNKDVLNLNEVSGSSFKILDLGDEDTFA